MKNVNLQDTAKTKSAEDVRRRYNLDVIKNITSKQTNSGNAVGIGKKAAVSKGLDVAGAVAADDKITAANGFFDKTGAQLCPTGMSFEWNSGTIPTGYLEEDGSAKSRTTYADLFAVIGTTYGAGDGSTTFNLPNSKGRVIAGYDSSQTEFNSIAKTGGEKTVFLDKTNMHRDITIPSYATTKNGSATDFNYTGWAVRSLSDLGERYEVPHNNLQPYIVKRKIIKY